MCVIRRLTCAHRSSAPPQAVYRGGPAGQPQQEAYGRGGGGMVDNSMGVGDDAAAAAAGYGAGTVANV